MHQIDGWSQFFDKRFFNLFDRSIILKELILLIRRSVKPPDTVLEIGCGSGLTSILLASVGYRITAIDANRELIQAMKQFTNVFSNLNFHQMDMFQLDFRDESFDLAFSQGVLEHYSDEDIVRSLVEQKRVAKIVVIDVPNTRGKIGDYGDERAITPKHWRQLIQFAGLEIIAESTRGMACWSQRNPKLLGWLEDSQLSQWFGENSIFITRS
ncbi:class I SAM-dependent methyltransferase [Candidatus Uhrbacteria bacterium]|nr:class I SAM-dependent methyltransferase [Candidatus Uhrbacteria bacterium]